MEAKLQEYRARRRRQELLESTKEKLEDTKKKVVDLLVPTFLNKMKKEKEEEVLLLEEEDEDKPPPKFIPLQTEDPVEIASEASEIESVPEESQESWRYFTVKWSLYIIIWITLYGFFLNIGFGAVFFVVSALIFVCINTRTRRKKPGEVSAYSVFNEDCQSIDGTLKAEELQRQMMFGIGGIRLF